MEPMEQRLLPAGGESGLAVNWGIPQFSGLPSGEAVFQIDCGFLRQGRETGKSLARGQVARRTFERF